VHCEQQDLSWQFSVQDLLNGIEAAGSGHRQVKNSHVGSLSLNLLDRINAILGLGHHSHICLGIDEHAQTCAQDRMIVRN
jgi:hypothetical protein